MRTNWPARGLRARSSASFESTVISPVDSTMTRQLFGSRIAPSRAARTLPAAVAQTVENRARFPPVDLAEFVENENGIRRARGGAFQAVRRRAPRPHIAGRTAAPPYARGGLQQRRLASARLAMKMNAAALLSGQMQQRPGQRRRYGENGQDMTARQRSDARLPVFERSARLVGTMRRAVENDGFGTARPDRRARQDKDRLAADVMPAGAQR